MGLFSGNNNDLPVSKKELHQIIDDARSDTVNKKNLSGSSDSILGSDPAPGVLNFLKNNEQPHYINKYTAGVPKGDLKSVETGDMDVVIVRHSTYCLTNRRLIIIYGRDQHIGISYEDIIMTSSVKSWTNKKMVMLLTEDAFNYLINELGPVETDGPFLAIPWILDFDSAHEYLENSISNAQIESITKTEEDYVSSWAEIIIYDMDNRFSSSSWTISRLLFAESYFEIVEESIKFDYSDIAIVKTRDWDENYIQQNQESGIALIEIVFADGSHLLFKPYDEDEAFDAQIKKILKSRATNLGKNQFSEYILVSGISNTATLKIDSWTDGSSKISANLMGQAETKGKSLGVGIGVLSRGYSSENSTITGDILGAISDNSYSSEIHLFKIYDDKVVIDADLQIRLDYSDISNVFTNNSNMVIETASIVYRISGISNHRPVTEAASFIKSKIANAPSNDENLEENNGEDIRPSQKLIELKNLYDEGIIDKIEFEEKKQEILENF
jgi:hypothetical protein